MTLDILLRYIVSLFSINSGRLNRKISDWRIVIQISRYCAMCCPQSVPGMSWQLFLLAQPKIALFICITIAAYTEPQPGDCGQPGPQITTSSVRQLIETLTSLRQLIKTLTTNNRENCFRPEQRGPCGRVWRRLRPINFTILTPEIREEVGVSSSRPICGCRHENYQQGTFQIFPELIMVFSKLPPMINTPKCVFKRSFSTLLGMFLME